MESKQMLSVPPHVLRPGPTGQFIPVAQHPATNRAGLGYGILRALGAHERLPRAALQVIASWSAHYGAAHGGVTPNVADLRGQDFVDRVGTRWSAEEAAPNAACYPGGRQGRSSYAQIYREVWVDQRWPELCLALGGRK